MTFAPVGFDCPDHAGVGARDRPAQRTLPGRPGRDGRLVRCARLRRSSSRDRRPRLPRHGRAGRRGGASRAESSFSTGALIGAAIDVQGDWYRLVTAMFLHGACPPRVQHARALLARHDRRAGARHAALPAHLLRLRASRARQAPSLLAALRSHGGASGAIYGILGALLVLEYLSTGSFAGQAMALIVVNLALTFAIPNISIGGHLGGLAGGVVATFALMHFRYAAHPVGRPGARGPDRGRELRRSRTRASRATCTSSHEPGVPPGSTEETPSTNPLRDRPLRTGRTTSATPSIPATSTVAPSSIGCSSLRARAPVLGPDPDLASMPRPGVDGHGHDSALADHGRRVRDDRRRFAERAHDRLAREHQRRRPRRPRRRASGAVRSAPAIDATPAATAPTPRYSATNATVTSSMPTRTSATTSQTREPCARRHRLFCRGAWLGRRGVLPAWKAPPSAVTAPSDATASDGTIISVVPAPSATFGRAWMYWYVSRSGVGSPSWMAGRSAASPPPRPAPAGLAPACRPRPPGSTPAARPSAVRICACLAPSAVEDRRALVALGAHLLLHRLLDRRRRVDRLELDPVDANAPALGRLVEHDAQVGC